MKLMTSIIVYIRYKGTVTKLMTLHISNCASQILFLIFIVKYNPFEEMFE